MRNSNLLKWAHPNNNKQNNKNGNPNWIHSPDALQRGHIAYLVKVNDDDDDDDDDDDVVD
ncbi:hypothetical protein RUM44_006418 [Polyplax serrata]|uniref:Uncharacterized protein n=1 Tax=Polyplax serrata TaxID=468196 RepID=A0ABR1AI43_POLSC